MKARSEPAGDEVFPGPARKQRLSQTRVPRAAKWLGGLGAIPFVFLAIAAPLLEGSPRGQALFALAAYGAVILSFLGGIHWGLAIADFGPATEGASLPRLTLSIVPSLIGWGALLLPMTTGLLALAAAFAAMLGFDVQASRAGKVPAWYPKLRWPLTIAAVVSLGWGMLW